MYDLLDITELTTLQNILFEGTEDAYLTAQLARDDPERFGRHHAVHQEIAHLFLQAATELLERLDRHVLAA